ncbi:MAG: glycosyltransferase family 4 protein [Ginsengibacter sp.]
MNILIFYQYFGTPKGGWSTRMYELPKRWIANGHKVSIVTSPYDKSDIKASGFIDKQVIDGIEVIIVNVKQSNKHSLLYRVFTFALFSVTAIYFALSRRFDIILCSSGPISVGLPGILAKIFRPKKKFVFEVRDLWPDGAVQLGLIKNKFLIKCAYKFEQLCYRKADLVVTCSKGMTESIVDRYDIARVLTVPNACDNEFFEKSDINFTLPQWALNKKIFLYTGSLGLMDNCVQIIKGIELFQGEDEVFVFIGEGKEKPELINYVRQKNLPNVFFLGLMPKTEVKSWLHEAYAAFVTFKNIPMLQTSSPNKMFDAFAAGVPIIQSTTGWIKDLVERSGCGLSVDPVSPVGMCEAIKFLSDNSDARNKMSGSAKLLAETEFNRASLAEKYLLAMNSTLKRYSKKI